MIVDSSCRRVDASDATRLFRTKILDVEQVVARFPELENELRNESQDRDQVENDFMYEQYQQSGLGAGGSMFASKAMPYDGTREAIRDYACFTRPEMKVERVSYDMMTPSAARGIIEAIYWKPAIKWTIDKIHVINPIKFTNIRRNEVSEVAKLGSIKKAMEKANPIRLSQPTTAISGQL